VVYHSRKLSHDVNTPHLLRSIYSRNITFSEEHYIDKDYVLKPTYSRNYSNDSLLHRIDEVNDDEFDDCTQSQSQRNHSIELKKTNAEHATD